MTACIHHWRIESPSGQSALMAYCRRCGAMRTFPASPRVSWHEAGRIMMEIRKEQEAESLPQ